MGINVKRDVECDRCGFVRPVDSLAGLKEGTIKKPGWSVNYYSSYKPVPKAWRCLCPDCTDERRRLDELHAAQINLWYNRTITALSIDFLEQYTDEAKRLLSWIRKSK